MKFKTIALLVTLLLVPLATLRAADAKADKQNVLAAPVEGQRVPSYLRGYEELYRKDPRQAALAWFRDAKLGLFVHYGLASLRPGGKSYSNPGDPSYEELRQRFRAEQFDAEAIAQLAVDAGARYVNFTPYHGGGPYLFRSAQTDFTSLKLPAGRDLVGEMAEACRKRGLGLFLYVHISMSQSSPDVIRQNYAMLRELLTQYGPIAGMWFDSVNYLYRERDRFPRLSETYAMVRGLQPQCLLSFKEGANGEEDFLAPEHTPRPPENNRNLSPAAREKLATVPVEICTTLQLDRKGGKGTKMWFNVEGAYHRNADEAWALLEDAGRRKANLLLNTGLHGDGSIDPGDRETLRELGRRLRAHAERRGAPAHATAEPPGGTRP